MLGSLVFGMSRKQPKGGSWKFNDGVRVWHGCTNMLEILTCTIVLAVILWAAGVSGWYFWR